MTAGDPTAWAERFRSFDIRFLEHVVAVWSRCLRALPPRPHEDTITTNLVDSLKRDGILRHFSWIEYQYEPFGHTSAGAAYSKGRIDLAVFLDQDRDRYLAYECKRLNDRRADGRRRSLAGEYVKHGLSCFTTGQYSERLPVGCMLGYVLDGDVRYAASSVQGKIVELAQDVALVGKPRDDVAIGAATRFHSRHRRGAVGDEVEIRHALLPM